VAHGGVHEVMNGGEGPRNDGSAGLSRLARAGVPLDAFAAVDL